MVGDYLLAEREGFEPSVPHRGTTVFETAPIDRSGTSPTEREQCLSTEPMRTERGVGTQLAPKALWLGAQRGGDRPGGRGVGAAEPMRVDAQRDRRRTMP
jgi:hypothetical protein